MESLLQMPQDIRLLLIERSSQSRLLIAHVLAGSGYQVSVASGGMEAIHLLQSHVGMYNAIITDLMAPGMEGLHLVRFIRSINHFDSVPVLVMSTYDDIAMESECLRSGADEFLLKPLTERQIATILQHVLRRAHFTYYQVHRIPFRRLWHSSLNPVSWNSQLAQRDHDLDPTATHPRPNLSIRQSHESSGSLTSSSKSVQLSSHGWSSGGQVGAIDSISHQSPWEYLTSSNQEDIDEDSLSGKGNSPTSSRSIAAPLVDDSCVVEARHPANCVNLPFPVASLGKSSSVQDPPPGDGPGDGSGGVSGSRHQTSESQEDAAPQGDSCREDARDEGVPEAGHGSAADSPSVYKSAGDNDSSGTSGEGSGAASKKTGEACQKELLVESNPGAESHGDGGTQMPLEGPSLASGRGKKEWEEARQEILQQHARERRETAVQASLGAERQIIRSPDQPIATNLLDTSLVHAPGTSIPVGSDSLWGERQAAPAVAAVHVEDSGPTSILAGIHFNVQEHENDPGWQELGPSPLLRALNPALSNHIDLQQRMIQNQREQYERRRATERQRLQQTAEQQIQVLHQQFRQFSRADQQQEINTGLQPLASHRSSIDLTADNSVGEFQTGRMPQGPMTALLGGPRLPVNPRSSRPEGWERSMVKRKLQVLGLKVPASEQSTESKAKLLTLRDWIDRTGRQVKRMESLLIFRQVAELLEQMHSHGLVFSSLRPSNFTIADTCRLSYLEPRKDDLRVEGEEDSLLGRDADMPEAFRSHQEVEEAQNSAGDGGNAGAEAAGRSSASAEGFSATIQSTQEAVWYTSPEELQGSLPTMASNIYCLGVMMFELFSAFPSTQEQLRAMADLRHRILPHQMLSSFPHEAGFCLSLLHPEPKSRGVAKEVLGSQILSGVDHVIKEWQAVLAVEEGELDNKTLLEFLSHSRRIKLEEARGLKLAISRLHSDIAEVHRRRQAMLAGDGGSFANVGKDSPALNERAGATDGRADLQEEDDIGVKERDCKRQKTEEQAPAMAAKQEETSKSVRSSRVMKNFSRLEDVYFSTRWEQSPEAGSQVGLGQKSLQEPSTESQASAPRTDWLGSFFDNLSKFARYSRFDVRANLKHGDLLNSTNMVCSIGFDREEEFFATAGVCKRIKVFDCRAVLGQHVDIHYPVVEIAAKSKLSSICWNSYIRSYLVSGNHDGIVQLWDTSTSQSIMAFAEHEKRVWSVDFSKPNPRALASGSDDGCVKLWNINQEPSTSTIRVKANVCCVQFSPDSSHLLAFGSADYKVYCYDLRHTRGPLCVLGGHSKAVSYVKFVDPSTLVSASTDNTLKLWDLNLANQGEGAGSPCSMTCTGHLNEKNFVGLSVSSEYIACGSENNAVFVYHKSLPMPMLSHRFGGSDPVTGAETEEDGSQFVSSVCWKGNTKTLVAANSYGNIKVLEMV